MDKQDRKLAISRYKERKSISGVYAVICTATGEFWVGTSRNLEAQKNSLWFALKMKSSPFGNLQQAWITHGEKEFKFEDLDRLADDFSDLLRSDELMKRRTLWAERLHASSL